MSVLILLSVLGAMGLAMAGTIAGWSHSRRDGLLRGGLGATAAILVTSLLADFGILYSQTVTVLAAVLIAWAGYKKGKPSLKRWVWTLEILLGLFMGTTIAAAQICLCTSSWLYISVEGFTMLKFSFSAGLAFTVAMACAVGNSVWPRNWSLWRCALAQTLLVGLFSSVMLTGASLLY